MEYMQQALASPQLLTIREYIRTVDYPIDAFVMDRFWHSLNRGLMIYVDDEIIQWIGFSSANAKDRKRSFMKVLTNVDSEELCHTTLDNDKYDQYRLNPISLAQMSANISAHILQLVDTSTPDSVRPCGRTDLTVENSTYYPAIDRSNGKNTTKHILVESECLRMVMMSANTSQSNKVLRYYIALERLVKHYTAYQDAYSIREADARTRETNAQLALATQQLALANTQLTRIGRCNAELLEYKKFLEKNETLYVASTRDLALQGLFKVSKTRNVKARNATHNTTHPIGDEFVILHEIKCRNSLHLEQRVKHVLQHFRPTKRREFYQISYQILIDTLDMMASSLNDEESAANDNMIAMELHKLTYDTRDWMDGHDINTMCIAGAPARLAIEGAPTAADVSTATCAADMTADDILQLLCEDNEQWAPPPPDISICVQLLAHIEPYAATAVVPTAIPAAEPTIPAPAEDIPVHVNIVADIPAVVQPAPAIADVPVVAQPAPVVVPPPAAQVHAVAAAVAPERILSVQMTRDEITTLITMQMQQTVREGIVLSADISTAIRNSLPHGKKTKYKAGEWKDLISVTAAGLNITIKRRAGK